MSEGGGVGLAEVHGRQTAEDVSTDLSPLPTTIYVYPLYRRFAIEAETARLIFPIATNWAKRSVATNTALALHAIFPLPLWPPPPVQNWRLACLTSSEKHHHISKFLPSTRQPTRHENNAQTRSRLIRKNAGVPVSKLQQ